MGPTRFKSIFSNRNIIFLFCFLILDFNISRFHSTFFFAKLPPKGSRMVCRLRLVGKQNNLKMKHPNKYPT